MPRNAPHLITYPDSLGGDIRKLHRVLQDYFPGSFGGVHLLPPFPSSADRGFAPTSYYEIDPGFGRWADIHALAESFEITLDLMVNHISRQSKYFVDFRSRKDASVYRDMFIRHSEFWPEGRPTQEDLERIYKRKPEDPFTEVRFSDGTDERLWCTFSPEQIDLDVTADKTREMLQTSMEVLARHGASILRLDAIAYVTKKLGTRCFFEEPEIWEILDFLRGHARRLGLTLLPEVHEHHRYQQRLAEHEYWTYDFSLPMLVLHGIYSGSARRLKEWFHRAPRHQFNTLDTHDGIGVVDVVDLLSDAEISAVREQLFSRGGHVKKRYNGPEYGNLDIYQINCTYYSALGEDDEAYLLARAIQCFAPGIPQIYYVGLLAGRNDIDLVERTRIGRNINRHNYRFHEIKAALERPVVRRLRRLLEFRADFPAFAVTGSLTILETGDEHLQIRRSHEGSLAVLEANLNRRSFRIRYGTVPTTPGEGPEKDAEALIDLEL